LCVYALASLRKNSLIKPNSKRAQPSQRVSSCMISERKKEIDERKWEEWNRRWITSKMLLSNLNKKYIKWIPLKMFQVGKDYDDLVVFDNLVDGWSCSRRI